MGRQDGPAKRTNQLALPVPGDEIGEQLQSGAVALFRMELRREDISPCDGASKRRRILGGSGRQRRIGRHRMDSCARNRTALPSAIPAQSGCARLWRTGLQPMWGTLSRPPSAQRHRRRRETATTRPAQRSRARPWGPPRSSRTASAGRGRCRGTAACASPRRRPRGRPLSRRGIACSPASRSAPAARPARRRG